MLYQLATVEEFFDNKDSCYLPLIALAERESVCVGQQVKLVLKINDGLICGEEKLWAEVIESENGYYIGKLVDGSALSENIAQGEKIDFSSEHIIMIW